MRRYQLRQKRESATDKDFRGDTCKKKETGEIWMGIFAKIANGGSQIGILSKYL
jgi:hypothetical protein